ncbi:N-acetylmuramic acid 6-phosphate etherase [Alkalibacterium sp. AK22]|uniref:N-acetylmuramic acid 6-phosphate etherase n=1 Tax=Alkalibacterium sp. AK22 TaxID=1229520 RepID=UPI0006849AA3|nr:N-acetylmuramic acid 6-phosphate etherase [Alkalibacterium sp. AK22]
MVNLSNIVTEKQNERTLNLDSMSYLEALKIMNEEDQKVPLIVKEVIPDIEKAVKLVVEAFNNDGRLIYAGAGTSGRLGVLDAAECPPTFGTSKHMVRGVIAGGKEAVTNAIEGAEDSELMGIKDLKDISLKSKDIVIGLAASGRTPYVKGCLKYANEIGAATVAISCNKNSEIGLLSDVPIEVSLGPEILTGSTRLKAGTAQKLILNMISTVSMIGIGKVYGNLMVDVQPTNEKLRERAIQIVQSSTGITRSMAQSILQSSNYDVKIAIICILLDIDQSTAINELNASKNHVRKAIENYKNKEEVK